MYQFCPHCGKPLPQSTQIDSTPGLSSVDEPKKPYDQTDFWKEMVKTPPIQAPPLEDIVRNACDNIEGESPSSGEGALIYVHVLWDRSITPRGGILRDIVGSFFGERAPHRHDPRDFVGMGYVVDSNGKIVTDKDGQPHFPVFSRYEAWLRSGTNGIDKEKCQFSVGRGDNPFFSDDRMLCFGLWILDVDQMPTALFELFQGFTAEPVLALPLRVRLCIP